MIDLIIKGKDREDAFVMMEKFHNALAGSPAYVESEIMISDQTADEEPCFHLIIGNNNDCDITRVINTEDIKDLI